MWKKFGIGLGIFVIAIYALFLIVPFFLTGIANAYSPKLSQMIEEMSGFKVKLEKISVVTTPKLTVGAKVGHIDAALPTGESFFTADNVQGKLSLLPVLMKKIEIDMVGADNVNLNLKVKKDGKFLIEDYIPKNEEQKTEQQPEKFEMPFNIKLSNKLPNIVIKNYNITFVDMPSDKSYSIYGNKASVKDFVLNKKVKISADGKFMLQDKVQFNYDVKLFNKVMPDVELNDLVFNPPETDEQPAEPMNINVIDIFKAIYNNQLTADVTANVATSGTFEDMNFDGFCNISNLGIAVDGKKLPASNADLTLKGNKIDLYSKLYSAENEITEIIGKFKTGKHPKIALNCKSNAKFKSLIDLIDSLAQSFGYNDLATLTATGGIDADFSLKSDMKTVQSSGFLKVPSASLSYGLYNIAINNINADIDFSNNMLNIKNAGLSVLNQPLNIKGTITQKADANISVNAKNLQLKGLLLALGQMSLLKENNISSGALTLNVDVKGRLDKIQPRVNLSIDNVNVKNIPSNTSFTLVNAGANIYTYGKIAGGTVNINNAKIINPAVVLTAPKAEMVIGEKDIDIKNAYVLYENTRIDITGKISDYLAKNIKLNLTANGLGTINLTGTLIDGAKKLDLRLFTTKTISMAIPGMKKSNLKADADISITGACANPYLKGKVNVPTLTMPDMAMAVENLNILLNGYIASGSGTLKKFTSGGIVAENLFSDFNLKNNVFYLNNIAGDAFSGKIGGNVSYNLQNGHIKVNFKGSDMDAEKAIAGAAGIKNALSGKLGFNADVALHGATDVEMITNLKGNVSFNIADGTLGNIGRFENFLFADNISSNAILKSAMNSISALPAIKNTAEFKTITGDLTFDNGRARLNPVKTTGPSMAYYITGRYNILNGTANVVVLGRLSAEIISLLGPLGDLSVDKLTSYIPKFGVLTGNLINMMTSDPKSENISAIPPLSSGNTNYKDFKVVFNGGVESRSSVKSFKWLSNCDTSAIDSLGTQIDKAKETVQQAKQQAVQQITDTIQEHKQKAQEAKQKFQDAKEGLKNLKNLLN